MEFLAQTGAWDPKDQAAVRRWFEEYLQWLTHSKNGIEERRSGNNHASWWAVQVAAVATFVEDHAAQQTAFDYYRDRILPGQIRADGSAPREEVRTRSLSYSAFNLEAFAMLCRIAQAHGTDLWTVRARNGAAIGTVIDYLEPYFADPRKWSKEQVAEFRNDGLVLSGFCRDGPEETGVCGVVSKTGTSRGRLAQLRGSDGRPMGSRRPPDQAPTRPGISHPNRPQKTMVCSTTGSYNC